MFSFYCDKNDTFPSFEFKIVKILPALAAASRQYSFARDHEPDSRTRSRPSGGHGRPLRMFSLIFSVFYPVRAAAWAIEWRDS